MSSKIHDIRINLTKRPYALVINAAGIGSEYHTGYFIQTRRGIKHSNAIHVMQTSNNKILLDYLSNDSKSIVDVKYTMYSIVKHVFVVVYHLLVNDIKNIYSFDLMIPI